jgi:hypothetical protein
MKIDIDFTPEKRKQMTDFYKAIKVASGLLPGNRMGIRQKISQHVDEIIAELTKDTPDGDKIQRLTDNIQHISGNAIGAK